MARTFVIMLCMLMAVFLVAMIAAKPVKADPQLMPNSVVPGFKCEARSSLIKGVESHGGAVAFFRQGGTHYAQAHGPVEGMDGWVYTVAVEPLTPEEIEARNDAQWAKVRAERNVKLSECDWTQLQDAPVDAAAWATYRQALRDITLQSDPFAIEWPLSPLEQE